MTDDAELLAAIARAPDDGSLRQVYADWLEERGDARCEFVRVHARVAPLPPDHPHRAAGEAELSRLRLGLDRAFLSVVEPERHHERAARPQCDCFQRAEDDADVEDAADDDVPLRWRPVELHREPQDTACAAWQKLLELVERTAERGDELLEPRRALTPAEWREIVTLPASIARLKSVRRLDLYGSHIVRVPPEIGGMTLLRSFNPYTSYRLHWLPYEITRCKMLAGSSVSTRTLYGNYKFRPPFPSLPEAHYPPVTRPCSVCRLPFTDTGAHRVWISLYVATDVLPLLVNACSDACVAALPSPASHYVPSPHRGGLALEQPRPR
jgi:uncharacterized protein (TIGR02996 family)